MIKLKRISLLVVLNRWLIQFGIDLRRTYFALRALPFLFKEYFILKKYSDFNWPIELSYPCLNDRFDFAGTIDKQYFYQDIYVANQIFSRNPINHIDIGSRIDGFIAHLAVFRKIKIIDIRPVDLGLTSVEFIQADICSENFKMDNAISVSCLHTIEHFGLGRYGDPIGFKLWEVGISNIWNIVDNSGILYLSFPVGKQRIVFNAHRIFKPSTVLNNLKNSKILSFVYIDDEGKFNETVLTNCDDIDNVVVNFDYGLGIFVIQKSIIDSI